MAEKVDIKNEQGVVRMSTQKYEGIIWPPMIQDPVKRVEDTLNFPYKDGDLFVCSYPRTGKFSIFFISFVSLRCSLAQQYAI